MPDQSSKASFFPVIGISLDGQCMVVSENRFHWLPKLALGIVIVHDDLHFLGVEAEGRINDVNVDPVRENVVKIVVVVPRN